MTIGDAVVSDLVGSSTMSLTEDVSFAFGALESVITVGGHGVPGCWDSVLNEPC